MFHNPDLASSARQALLRRELVELVPSLRARALKLCLNRAEAQDLVQDTIERALRFENTYQPGTNLRAWTQQILFTIFVTGCRRGRRERRALSVLTGDPCAWTYKDGSPAMAALSPRLGQLLEELPPQFAAVVKLVDLQDWSYKDAAVALEVPVGTVMSRLFRARRMLATALSSEAAACARAA
jgi:RNA polymerase sigma-70 factor (ECF subfamily)